MAFSHDGRLIASGGPEHAQGVRCRERPAEENKIVSGSDYDALKVWDPKSREEALMLKPIEPPPQVAKALHIEPARPISLPENRRRPDQQTSASSVEPSFAAHLTDACDGRFAR
jgi:hypothetical protein